MVAKPCVSSKTMPQIATSSSKGICVKRHKAQKAYLAATPPSVNHARSVLLEIIQRVGRFNSKDIAAVAIRYRLPVRIVPFYTLTPGPRPTAPRRQNQERP